MKVTINTTAPQSREIDWSKPMVVQSGSIYVLTNGYHAADRFSGVNINTGEYCTAWAKGIFNPCTTPITVTFENEL